MRVLRALAAITLVFGAAIAFLLLVPRHVHLKAEFPPSASGERAQLTPSTTLHCGSVAAHGPDWNPEGGDCWGALRDGWLEAVLTGFIGLALGAGTIGAPLALRQFRKGQRDSV
jgi:hypothetical protein